MQKAELMFGEDVVQMAIVKVSATIGTAEQLYLVDIEHRKL